MCIELEIEVFRNERGEFSGLEWVAINKISEPVTICMLSIITESMDKYPDEFANEFDFGRARFVDIVVGFDGDSYCEQYAECIGIVKIKEEFEYGFFVYEVGYEDLFTSIDGDNLPF